jgi:hypothetical protein
VKVLLNTVGALLACCGIVWILQGVNVLPGSFMTGQIRWAVIGGVALAAGIGLIAFARRLGRSPNP